GILLRTHHLRSEWSPSACLGARPCLPRPPQIPVVTSTPVIAPTLWRLGLRLPAGQHEIGAAVVRNQPGVLGLTELAGPGHPMPGIDSRTVRIVAVVFPKVHVATLVCLSPAFGRNVLQRG